MGKINEVDKKTQLKALNTQKGDIINKIIPIKKDIKERQKELSKKQQELSSVENKIKALTSGDLTISEHAILRHIERVEKFDIKLIEDKIMTELKSFYSSMGNGSYPIFGKFRAIIKNGVVVTITK